MGRRCAAHTLHNRPMPRLPFFRLPLVGLCAAGLWAGQAGATIALRCAVTYAGATRQVVATPVQNPYVQPGVDIDERFVFKPVLVGTPTRIDRVNLYVYLNTGPQPVLVQQAKYLPPFHWPADGAPLPLTGQQYLYAGPVERELIYQCALHREAP